MPYPVVPEPENPDEMRSLTPDQNQTLIHQRNEKQARTTLVESLVYMGRFAEALEINIDPEQEIRIKRFIKAEEKDDDHRCNCKATLDMTDWTRYSSLPDEEKAKIVPVLMDIPNYNRSYRHWSDKYNSMAYFYQCHMCGCIQTLPDGVSIAEINDEFIAKQQEALNVELKLRRR